MTRVSSGGGNRGMARISSGGGNRGVTRVSQGGGNRRWRGVLVFRLPFFPDMIFKFITSDATCKFCC